MLAASPALAVTPCGTDCFLADTCERAEVQAAIAAALAQSGGTVRIPDPAVASCDWSSAIEVDASKVPLHIQGKSEESTHIRAPEGAFVLTGAPGLALSLSHLKLSDGACSGSCDAMVAVGGSDQWRVHHLRLETTGALTRLFRTSGNTAGLVDHITVRGSTPSEFVTIDGEDWSEWKTKVDLGSAAQVYIEDCDIAFTDAWEGRPFDGERGGRAVIRHNTIKNQILGNHGFDTGGTASMLSVVAYGNAFVIDDDDSAPWSSKTWARFAHFRGGTGLLYGNTWNVGSDIWINGTIDLAIYRNPDDSGGNESWKPCNGTQYRMCSNIGQDWSILKGDFPANCETDQDCQGIASDITCKWKFCSKSKLELCETDNQCPAGETCSGFLDGAGVDGYPCFMQPGYATQMQPYPWYEWGNTWAGGQGGSACATPPCDVDFGTSVSQLVQGRDYFDDVAQGSAPPATCTPLEAFWVESEQTLYRCESQDKWGVYYKAYPYPHPLQSAGVEADGGSDAGVVPPNDAGKDTGAMDGAAGSGADGGAGSGSGGGSDEDSGCGCTATGQPRSRLAFLVVLAIPCLRRRKRANRDGCHA